MKVRNVSVLLLYKNSKFLLQHRSDDSSRLPGYWGFFGGGIDECESPEQAVVREIKEELEYDMKPPRKIDYCEYEWNGWKIKSHVFIEEYDEKQKLVLHEGKGMGWKTAEEISSLKMIDADKEVIKKVKGIIG